MSKTFAIIGRTFNIIDGAAVTRLARLAAIGLVQQMQDPCKPSPPFGVWAAPSSHDGDALVIAAHHLMPDRAAGFGFYPLAPAAN